MKLFSVITICYNEVDYIRSTCESISKQTYRDFEWIVIDGGSTDGTGSILEEYRDQITALISESDEGIYDAMNKGIALAAGEYIVFMNGGDCFSDEQVLTTVAEAPKKDILSGDLRLNDTSGEILVYPETLPTNYLLKKMLPHQASFIRRSLFKRIGNYDTSYRIAGDYEWFARALMLGGATYAHIPQVLAIFSDEGISQSSEHRVLRKQENHRVRKTYFPQYRWSFKCFRQELRNRIASQKGCNAQ